MRIVVCDGLEGLPESIGAIWPLAVVQTCVLHLIRNAFRSPSDSTGIRSLDPTGRGAERWMNRWKPALNAFAVTFG